MENYFYEIIPIVPEKKHEVYTRDTKLDGFSLKIQAFKEKYTLYFEEEKNVLFGSNTPFFIAKTNSTNGNDNKPSVVYEKKSWVRKFL